MTVGRWIDDRARITPHRVAIDFQGDAISYLDVARSSLSLAAELHGRGLRKGDRIAVLSDNCPEFVSVVFACAHLGLIVTPINWRLAPAEVAYHLSHAGASLLLFSESRRDLAKAGLELSDREIPLRPIEDPAATAEPPPEVDVADDDPLFLIYTSGTTGRPKGALLSHANCFWTNTSIDRLMDVTTFDVVLQILPQFHIGGWNVQPLLAWSKGATVVLEESFDPGRALALIEEKRVTTMMGVPANYLFMAEHDSFDGADLSSLRMAVVGGAPMPEALLRRWMDRGVSLVQGYGLSEAAPNVLGLPPEYATKKLGYAGKGYPFVDGALSDGQGGLVEGPGVGELLVRGPNVFLGYWQDPEATVEAMSGDWLHTGDVAERDADGFYRIRDRVKDMYISGGENVYPAEVESVLADHPDIVEAAIIGVPDDRWGEVGVAFVVVRRDVSPEQLASWCKERVAAFKVPKSFRVIDELPRSGMNKVLKPELAKRIEEEQGRG